jgi:hypothetical protein
MIFVIMGFSVAIDRKHASAALEKISQDRGLLLLWGFLNLTMGSVIVVMNNVWTSGLPLLVTVLGWIMVVKAAFLLLLPGPAIAYYRVCNKEGVLIFGGIVAFLFGLVLLYLRFS